jgi:hypothetical protein
VGLAGAGVADEAQRFAFFDPLAGGQGVDERGCDGGVGGEVEVVEPFLPGEAGGFQAAFGAAAVAVLALGHEQFGEVAAVGHLLAGGGVGGSAGLGAHGGQVQDAAGGLDAGLGGLFGQAAVAVGGGGHGGSPRRRRVGSSWS